MSASDVETRPIAAVPSLRVKLRKMLPESLKRFLLNLPFLISVPRQMWWCATQGLRWKQGWRLYGKPQFRMAWGGKIFIGERFCARSESSGNSIGVFQPAILTAWGTDSRLEIGDDVGISGCSISATKRIRIGHRVLVGAGALITDSDAHPLHPEDRKADLEPRSLPVEIGDDAFIGARAIILKGVRIGEGAVVGAGAVVTTDVPAFKVAAGNPAKIVGDVKKRS